MESPSTIEPTYPLWGHLAAVILLGVPGLLLSYGALFHWPATQKRFGWLLYWGRGWFPASRLGSLCSGLTCVWLAIFAAVEPTEFFQNGGGDWFVTLTVVWIFLMTGVGVRDYFLHLDRCGKESENK